MFIKQKISLTTVGAALIALGTLEPARAASFYSITDLGTLPGSSGSIATGINDSGQVVGYLTKDGPFRAFFWENGEMTDLGTLGGSRSVVYGGINNSGQVVGEAETGKVTYDGYPVSHAFLWSKSVGMTNLSPNAGFLNTSAEGINNTDQVIGSTENGNAFLLENGVTTDICQPGQSCEASDINNSDQVVGNLSVVLGSECYEDYYEEYCYDITTRRAFLWENGKATDLGTIGDGADAANSSYAFAINDAAQIVGEANGYAVIWEDGIITDIGTLGGRVNSALDINNLGQVVGRSAITDYYSDLHAFVWDATKGMQDLNSLIPADSGWLLSEARAINEAGQIVGSGTINGQERAFLLTPQPIPEPASVVGILAFGAFGAGALLLRKQRLTPTRLHSH